MALTRLISSEGRIVFLGDDINQYSFKQMRKMRDRMQVVFQDPFGSLSPRMSVGEIVGEGLGIHMPELSKRQREEKVIAALAETGLDPETRHRYPHEFSGGQRQRIAIARAIVLEPKFIMLDEPTSALDMSVQAQVVDLLRDIQKRKGLAYMFISHDLKVVKALANEVIVMRHGKVVEQGPSAKIFNDPQTDYTKALMAAAFDMKAIGKGIVEE
jgi:microcin C transport system ATP-binding protein